MGALHLDFQHHMVALLPPGLYAGPGGAVGIAHIGGVFQHPAGAHQLFKFLLGLEEVGDPLLLPLPGGAGGGGDRDPHILVAGQKLLEDGALAAAGGAGEHN